jgi:hypothetical protein
MINIAILPLDDRPVNYDYPVLLARIAGAQVTLPPREWLGNPWRGSQHARLVDWMQKTAASADVLIVAADTLAYGGLIPSRTSLDPFETAEKNLSILSDLKAAHPHLKIYASSVILRVSRDNSSEEERPYWATYGSRMFRLSSLEHKSDLNEASGAEIAERDALKREIPAEVYADYHRIRTRNHRVNRRMLDYAADGTIDYLLLPQDDTADYGWNIAEARALQLHIRRNGLTRRAITYPGADEIGCLLLAKAFCDETNFRPRIFPRFSSAVSLTQITAYEDRPMLELVKAHLAPLNGILADSPAEADCVLFINAPAIKQGVGDYQYAAQFSKNEFLQRVPESLQGYVDELFVDPGFQNTRREMQTPQRSPEEFCRAIVESVRQGRTTAIADVAFVNGSDLILGRQLVEQPEIASLAAYGGWNTAGNTLGTVLAQAVISIVARQSGWTAEQRQAQFEFLFLRFLDDYCYQALERSRCLVEDLPEYGLMPSEARLPDGEPAAGIAQKVAARLQDQAVELENTFQASGLVKAVHLSGVYLPWQRLFEIGCEIQADLA